MSEMIINLFASGAVEPSYDVFDIVPEATLGWGIAQIDFYPSAPGNGGFDFGITHGREPSSQWYMYEEFTSVEHTGIDQWWIKAEVVEVITGRGTAVFTEAGGNLGEWNDLWNDWIVELQDEWKNGIAEEQIIKISLAEDDGGGSPDLGTIVERVMRFKAYRGEDDYLVQDEFTGTGSLTGHSPNIDRRPTVTTGWRDVFWDESNYDMGYFNRTGDDARAVVGSSTNHEAIYVIDAEFVDFQYATDINFETAQVPAGIVGRLQDSGNFWLLAVKNPDATDPVLGLYKVASGSHSLVASKTLTGLGPFLTGDWYGMRLSFDGNDIMGEIGFSDSSVAARTTERMYLTHTDAAYNTETDAGMWAESNDPEFKRMSLSYWPQGYNPLEFSTSPITTSITDNGTVYNNVYFYEGSNDPGSIHSNGGYWVDKDTLGWFDTINVRNSPFNTDMYVLKVEAVSGDTADIEIREYGTTLTGFGTWMDLYRCDIRLFADIGESKSAVVDVTIGIDNGSTLPMTAAQGGFEVTKRITFNSTSLGT